MKNLVKLLTMILVVTMSTASFAQSLSVKGGLNFANMLAKNDVLTLSDDFKTKLGVHIGATAEFDLPVDVSALDKLSFETGLLLSTKGYRMKVTEELMVYGQSFKIENKETVNLLYLDIPLTGKAYFDIGGAKLYGVFGPYIGMGLSGKDKEKVTVNGETEKKSRSIKWGSGKDNDIKRLDLGLTLGAGVQISDIQVGLAYNLGLGNVAPVTDGGTKAKHRVFSITASYKLKTL